MPRSAALLMLFCSWFSLPPAAFAALPEAQARALFEASGLDQQLAQFSTDLDRLTQQFSAHLGGWIDQGQAQALSRIIAGAFDPVAFSVAVLGVLQQALDPRSAAGVIAWYRSDAGMRLSQHEQRFAEVLAREPHRLLAALSVAPDPGRAELVGRIEAGAQLTDRVVGMSVPVVRVWIDGLQAAGLAEYTGATDLTGYRDQLGAFLKPVFIRMLSAVYAGASDEDLVAYLLFLESDPGRRFHAVVLDAVATYYETAATAMAADLGGFLVEVRHSRTDVNASTESPR